MTFDPGGFHNYKTRDDAQRLTTDYDIGHLNDILRDEERYLREHVEDKEKLIAQVRERIALVESTVFVDTVYLHRRKYGSDPVVYYVGVNHTPQVPDGERHHITLEARRFDGGPSKKEAFEYAEMLSKKYNCPIVKEGFGEGSR